MKNLRLVRSARRGMPFALAGAGLVSLVAVGALRAATPPPEATSARSLLRELSNEFQTVAAEVRPSVVHIEVRGKVRAAPMGFHHEGQPGIPDDLLRRFFGIPGMPDPGGAEPGERELDSWRQGVGSGWIWDAAGHVVTNNHVVRGADAITVKLSDGDEHPAHVVAVDEPTDIAVLKIDAGGLQPLRLAPGRAAQGDIVFAFGSPMEQEFSLSQGVVSGVGRQTGILGPSGYEDFIQTDAAINPGNSGGPLTDIDGRLVGMNTAIMTQSGQFSGMGFAIPAGMLKPVVERLIADGRVSRGWLGISIQDDAKLLRSFGHDGRAVLVSDVLAEQAGAAAGLRRGDIITAIDGEPMESVAELRVAIASRAPGSVVRLTVERDGRAQELQARLGELTADARGSRTSSDDGARTPERPAEPLRKLGLVRLSTFTPDAAAERNVEHAPGVLVEGLRPGSVAARAGIRAGEVITEVDGAPVSDLDELQSAVEEADGAVRLTLFSGGLRRYVVLEPAS